MRGRARSTSPTTACTPGASGAYGEKDKPDSADPRVARVLKAESYVNKRAPRYIARPAARCSRPPVKTCSRCSPRNSRRGTCSNAPRRARPTPANDIARAAAIILQLDCGAEPWGTYNYCSSRVQPVELSARWLSRWPRNTAAPRRGAAAGGAGRIATRPSMPPDPHTSASSSAPGAQPCRRWWRNIVVVKHQVAGMARSCGERHLVAGMARSRGRSGPCPRPKNHRVDAGAPATPPFTPHARSTTA